MSGPTIIDIEASGFGHDSYPIEVGVADFRGRRFSRLIKPMAHWQHWSSSAQAIHGISQETLVENGCDARSVAQDLNQFLMETCAYSDAWVKDKQWLDKLFFDTRVRPSFQFSPLEKLMSEAQMEIWDDCKTTTIRLLELQRHRASTDALVIQRTYVYSKNLSLPKVAQDLE